MTAEAGPNIIYSGLLAYLDASNSRSYPGTGTVWNDLSPNKHDFTLGTLATGSPVHNSSGFFQFNGDGGYAYNTATTWNLNEITVSIFAKDWNAGMLGSSLMYFGPDHDGWRFEPDAARTWHNQFPEYSNIWGTYNSASWNLFTYVHSNTFVKSYRNGIVSSTNSAGTYTFQNNYNKIDIGAYTLQEWNTGGYLNGKISTVIIHNRALSDSEILQNYNALKGRYGL